MDYGTESDNYAQLFLESFGQESPELARLFKSDFGQETPDWFLAKSPSPVAGAGLTHPAHLDQGVTGASHGSTPGLTSSPRVPKITRVGPTQVNTTPSPTDPQTHINRLSQHGIRVTDNMPGHYTPEQRAGAINNVANAVDFMHGHFPGLANATRKHNMEYNFTGPQIQQHGPGEYSIVHGSYDESSPHAKINIHTAGEQTLWHEHLHFLDHALKGRIYYATDYEDHPLNKLAESLKNTQAHKDMLMSDPDAREYLTGTPTIDNHKHHNYLTDNREVLARFFNQYMHHAATTTGGLNVAEAPSTTEEQYTPEDLVKHGQLFRDALISHGWTKSFAAYLDSLDKGIKPIGSWGRGSFKMSSTEPSTPAAPAPATPATPQPAPAPTTPPPITPDVPTQVGEATGKLHDHLAQEYAGRSDVLSGLGDKEDAHHAIATHMLANNPVSLEDHIQARIAMRPGSSYKRLHDYLSGLSDLDQHKDLLRTFDNHWIGSVNSSEPEHVIANRVNAGRVFGLNSWEKKPDYIQNLAWKKGMRLADDPHFQKVHGSYLKSMYAHTQSELAKRGLESVALIRGVHKISDPDLMQSIRDQYKDGDMATGHMDTNLAPLSSFTLSPKVAGDYGGITPKYNQSSATLNMVGHVPASRILSLWNTGYGYGDHHEVVALGGPARMHWATHSYDSDVMKDWLHKKQRGLIKSMNIPTVDIDDSAENLEWLQPPEIKEKYHNKAVTKSFGEYLSKALEETHQQKPAPGSHRQTRTPRSYNIPRKITRPGVRGSTLWWIDPKTGTVRYGPKPKPKDQRDDPPGEVKNYLQSEQPWSFMSAYSDKRDEQSNALAHVKLGQQLQSAGYKVTPSKGYYTDTQTGQLREEPSYFVMGMGTKDAIPVGQEFGQESILTNHGMFDMAGRTLAPISYKRVINGDLPKSYPQTVVMTPNEHVTIVIDTGQPRPLT